MELILTAAESLRASGHLVPPKVFLVPKITGALRERLEGLAKAKGCRIALSEANATHIVYPPTEVSARDGSNVVVAGNIKDHEFARMHYLRYPDSYDSWIPAAEVPPAVSIRKPEKPGPVHVTGWWLADYAEFNEPPNPADYLIDDAAGSAVLDISSFDAAIAAEKAAGQRDNVATAGKRKRSPSPPAPPRRRAAVGGNPASGEKHIDPEPKVKQVADTTVTGRNRETSLKRPRNAQLVDISASDGPEPQNLLHHSNVISQERLEETAPTALVEQQQYHTIIPSAAAWFDYEKLDEIEIKALPEFFNGVNKVPASFLIAALYNLNS